MLRICHRVKKYISLHVKHIVFGPLRSATQYLRIEPKQRLSQPNGLDTIRLLHVFKMDRGWINLMYPADFRAGFLKFCNSKTQQNIEQNRPHVIFRNFKL